MCADGDGRGISGEGAAGQNASIQHAHLPRVPPVSHMTGHMMSHDSLLTRTHREEVGEEILDLLLSFSDFLSFKQLMLDHKAVSSLSHTHTQWLYCCVVCVCFLRERRVRLWILVDWL